MTNAAESRAAAQLDAPISVVVVTFNSASTLSRCLDSIPSGVEVVVVDQNSRDDSADLATRHRPSAKVIRAGRNRGFGAGCNLGAANATGSVLVFLNPDAYLQTGSLHALARAVVERNALVGPVIVDESGNAEISARKRSRMMVDLVGEILPYRLARGVFAKDIPTTDDVYTTGGVVGYVYGSCMAIDAQVFEEVGGFDERYFLYHEEETLARKLDPIGVAVHLEPEAVIIHTGKVSTAQTADFAISQHYRSRILYYSTFYPPYAAMAYSWTLWSLLQLMAATTPIRRRLGLRPSHDVRWYRAASRGVVDGRRNRIVNPPQVGIQYGSCDPRP